MRTLVAPLTFCACVACAAQGVTPSSASASTGASAAVAPAASASASISAATSPAAAAGPSTASEARLPGEPEVRRTVIDDDGVRIEELRVRGVPQRIVVTTKGPRGSTYEIITGDGSRDLSDGVNTSRGAAGKRVWRVLDF